MFYSIRSIRALTLAIVLVGLAFVANAQQQSSDGVWTPISVTELERRQEPGSRPGVRPERFRAFELTLETVEEILLSAPAENDSEGDRVLLSLPRPDGSYERFAVVKSPVMHPEVEQQMADLGWPIKTYRGESIDRAATSVRLDWGGPDGFHAIVLAPGESYYIDPYWKGNRSLYVSYFKHDYRSTGKSFSCELVDQAPPILPVVEGDTGGQLRVYRLANAATGEYTQFHGGTQAGGFAAITTTVNRVNAVYERDLSARLELVANNLDLVYTDSGMDPYSNGSCGAMVDENQANIDAVIGTANYDIGHVFGEGDGGFGPGDVCVDAEKARGCTEGNPPEMDPFDIDFVAHEIGHQFGGSHTWNGTSSSCSSGAWTSHSAYEPGSGSTIMAYAGICDVDNLQNNSDDHFHRRSLDQILAYMSGGGNCSSNTGGVNPSAPTVDAGPSYTIPAETPFHLEARDGADADNDSLTYNWEEFDLGTRAPLSTGDDGVQPIFRSWPSSSSPVRVFPRIEDLIVNTTALGETLPTTSRTLNFQVTIRDNRAGGGREGKDSTTVISTDTAGPFRVTAPDGGETVMTDVEVTWNVANTTAAPVATGEVDIFLSTDGGLTYPFKLASVTPNDGAETVQLPGVETDQARIKVKGAGNIFFDISNADFTIENGSAPHMLVLLDRTGSMSIIRSSGNSRCADALTLAKEDVDAFSDQGSRIAVWTFANDRASDLTGGFVDQATARLALDALAPEGCGGATPLAEALCAAGDALASLGDGVGEKNLAVSSDGGENNSSGDCAGPSSTSPPPWDPGSWQEKVEMRIAGNNIVQARFWGDVTRSAFDPETGELLDTLGVADALFFEHLATITGGEYQPVGDSDPLPPPFFGPRSVIEVPTLSAWGLMAIATLLALAGMALVRRRA